MQGLSLGAGSQVATLDQLRQLPTPEVLGARHQPLPHHVLVDTLIDQLPLHGWDIHTTQMGTTARGSRLFGTMTLRSYAESPASKRELSPTLGFRSSTNSALSIRMVVGATVFVCDNLCFSGDEFVLRRKSTTGLLDLPRLISDGIDRFSDGLRGLDEDVDKMKDSAQGSHDAKSRLFDIFEQGVMPLHLLPKVSALYFQPDDAHTDCQPRSLWGLNNACTRAIHELKKPAAKFAVSQQVGQHFHQLVH